MRFVDDVRICMIFFTRLPVKWQGDLPRERITHAFGAIPVIGLIVGAIGGLVYFCAGLFGLDPFPSAVLAVGAQIITTGAFHEDGWADVFDGFGGGRSTAEKIEIMRDSRLGTFGAAALLLALLLNIHLIAQIGFPLDVACALMASGALGRAALVAVMRFTPAATDDGQSAEAGRPSDPEMITAIAIAGSAALILLLVSGGFSGITAMLIAGAFALAAAFSVGLWAKNQIGGQTGDVLGASAVAGQLAALAAIAALVKVG